MPQKISVIIPAYNSEKTIKETIESVFNQTYTHFEIIVINDGSTDSTLEVLSKIQDPRLKVFSYPNAKQAVSRNRGISHSSGEYIAFLDADDLWKPDKLEAQLNALESHSQAAVAYSWTDYIDESGQFLRPGGYTTVNGNAYPHLLIVNIIENGSNPLIRRDALSKIGDFDPSLTPMEDWDLWIRLAAQYHFITVPTPQVLYRQSRKSASTNIGNIEAASKKFVQKTFTQAPASLQYLKKHCLSNIYKYLTFKALKGHPERTQSWVAIRYLYQILVNDPSMLKQRVSIRALLKIATVLMLPRALGEKILSKMGRIDNLGALMILIKTDPSEL